LGGGGFIYVYLYNMKYIISEQQKNELKDNLRDIIQSYLDKNIENYYAIKRFWVDYNDVHDSYDINIFFDRQIAVEMGGGINMLIRRAGSHISHELNEIFNGIKLKYYVHY